MKLAIVCVINGKHWSAILLVSFQSGHIGYLLVIEQLHKLIGKKGLILWPLSYSGYLRSPTTVQRPPSCWLGHRLIWEMILLPSRSLPKTNRNPSLRRQQRSWPVIWRLSNMWSAPLWRRWVRSHAQHTIVMICSWMYIIYFINRNCLFSW